ncbi:hypothetical protein GPECTOR_14g192 [Gonium pectorale]|uniref:Uncharacterized protein n=1 Tax=Gonium pectorale TaxID=33097 RepID=A0A150GM58_GONPE|nr:hypothetical protein GPECTOR_14g192 [Gonium pectorale]|eukprot:KXZ50946.1 hypothetical protein GPECTOR_14g192 [Gonium pectorale]
MSKKGVNSKLDKFLTLGPEDGSESVGSEGTSGSEDEAEQQEKQPRKKPALSLEDLEKAGYKSGPSVLFVKPPAEQEPQDWNWSNGKAAKGQEDEDDHQDRAATREAVTRGLEESAAMAVKAMGHAARMREAARQEREEVKQERMAAADKGKPLSFNQKASAAPRGATGARQHCRIEKRKRDAGQTSRAKNYVEESKRQAREYGVYSGFD